MIGRVYIVGVLFSLSGCSNRTDDNSSSSTSTNDEQSTNTAGKTDTDTSPSSPTSQRETETETSHQTDTHSNQAGGTDSASIKEDTVSEPGDTASNDRVLPDAITIDMCLEQTPAPETCRSCCDCGTNIECTRRAFCREQCDAHDFEKNDSFILFELHSPTGDGKFQDCIMRGEERACKACCDCSAIYRCGDLSYCRAACENLY